MSGPLWGQTLESLYSFPAAGSAEEVDGRKPLAGLVEGLDGNFYGTASEGGELGGGTAFRFSPTTGEFKVLDSFDPATTGQVPEARMINVGDGFLYGATRYSGTPGSSAYGSVYRLDPDTETLSLMFKIAGPGDYPEHPLSVTLGEAGALHVLCEEPGGIWRVPLDGSPATVARNFDTTAQGRINEGSFHRSIMRASDGFLYGVAFGGGVPDGGGGGQGILFRVAPDGSNFFKLHDCDPATGKEPIGKMLEIDGFFYGLMEDGGSPGKDGVLYRVSPQGEYKVIYEFDGPTYPQGDLLLASDGMIYGAWQINGPGGNGSGGIFRIRPDGKNFKALYTFEDQAGVPQYPKGRAPVGGLVQGRDGNIYGMTELGGLHGQGTIFRLKLKLPPPPINRPPIAVDDVGVLTGESVTVNVLTNDFDADGDTLSVTSIEDEPSFGTAEVQTDGTIVYTPEPGDFEGDSFTYKVSDLRGGSTVATVTIQSVPAGPLVQAGTYNGLVFLDEELDGEGEVPRGQYVLTVKEDGRFTGTLFSQKKRASIRGEFSELGTAFAALTIPNDGKGLVFLAFQRGTPNTVRAVVLGSNFWSGFAGPTTPSGFDTNRKYTVQIVPDNAPLLPGVLPEGHGYGTVTIKPAGVVTMIGKLGDGTTLKWSSNIVRFPEEPNVIPIYSVPLKDGVYAGYVRAAENNRFEGFARWERPESNKPTTKPYGFGFSGQTEIWLAPFTPPTGNEPVIDLNAGNVVLQGAPGGANAQGQFTIEGKKITRSGDLRSLAINRANGLYSGTMRSDGKTISFKGAIDQGGKFGLGHAIVKGVTRFVELFGPMPE
jgi:uncharacterized repeat protein (TIGR03803 family)